MKEDPHARFGQTNARAASLGHRRRHRLHRAWRRDPFRKENFPYDGEIALYSVNDIVSSLDPDGCRSNTIAGSEDSSRVGWPRSGRKGDCSPTMSSRYAPSALRAGRRTGGIDPPFSPSRSPLHHLSFFPQSTSAANRKRDARELLPRQPHRYKKSDGLHFCHSPREMLLHADQMNYLVDSGKK